MMMKERKCCFDEPLDYPAREERSNRIAYD